MSAIQIPPSDGLELQEWRADVAGRVRALFDSYGISLPSVDNGEAIWLRLALQMAIKHKEPGFEISEISKATPTKRDEDEFQDRLMNWFLFGELRTDADGCQYARELEDCQCTMTEASKRTVKELRKRKKLGQYSGFIPSTESVRTQYSARKSRAARDGAERPGVSAPSYVFEYLAHVRLITEIESTAQSIFASSSLANFEVGAV